MMYNYNLALIEGNSGSGQQKTLNPRPHLLVLPSFRNPPPQEDEIPLMLISPGKHWAEQSEDAPCPLLSPRQMHCLGAAFVGQQIGLPQC